MDESFIPIYNYGGKVVGKKNTPTCEVIHGKKYNSKEGATIIAASKMKTEEKIPLAIVAKGKSKRCEKKFGVQKNDDEIIFHSPNGWTNSQVMIKYLEWLSGKMDHQKFVLVLDVYKSHLKDEVLEKADELGIHLIFVPACGTGMYQPLDISVFGIFKEKLKKYEKENKVPDEGTKRYSFFIK